MKTKPTCSRGYSCGFGCISQRLVCHKNVDKQGKALLESYSQFLQRTEVKSPSAGLYDADIDTILARTDEWLEEQNFDKDLSDEHDSIHVLLQDFMGLSSADLKNIAEADTLGRISILEEELVSLVQNDFEKWYEPNPFRPDAPIDEADIADRAKRFVKDGIVFGGELFPDSKPSMDAGALADIVLDLWQEQRRKPEWPKLVAKARELRAFAKLQ